MPRHSCLYLVHGLYDLRYIVQSDRMMPTVMRIRWTNLSLCWPLGYKFAPCTVYVRSNVWRAPPALNARGCQRVLAIVATTADRASRTLHNDLCLSHDLAFPRCFRHLKNRLLEEHSILGEDHLSYRVTSLFSKSSSLAASRGRVGLYTTSAVITAMLEITVVEDVLVFLSYWVLYSMILLERTCGLGPRWRERKSVSYITALPARPAGSRPTCSSGV